jgi:hypothetical protein
MGTTRSGARAVGAALLALSFLFTAVAQVRTFGEPEFWTRLASGRATAAAETWPPRDTLSFTAPGATVRSADWLFDALLYGLWRAGGPALILTTFVALLLGAFALGLGAVAKKTTPAAGAAAVLLAGWLAASRSTVGPQTVSVFFVALFLWLFSRPRPLPLLATALIAAQGLWTQMDEAFLLGPVLAAVAAIEFAADRRVAGGGLTMDERRRLGGLAALAVVLLAVTFLHPAGWGVHRAVLAGWREPPPPGFSVWLSPYAYLIGSTLFRHLLIGTLFVGALGLMVCPQRLPLLVTASALLGGFLALRSLFLLPLFTGLSLPFLAMAVGAIAREARRRFRWSEITAVRGGAAVLAVAALFSIVQFASGAHYRRVGSLSRFGIGVEERPYPSAAALLLDRPAFARRLLHLPMDGGYLAWRYPHRAVFCDMRKGVYDVEFRRSVGRWAAGDFGAFKALADHWHADALLINALWPTAGDLVRAPLADGWALIYFDGVTAVLVPRRPEFAAWIESPALGEVGLRRLDKDVNRFVEALRRGRRPHPPPAAIGAAGVFDALDHSAPAADLYEWLSEVLPDSPPLAFQRGIAQCKAGRFEAAAASLEKAVGRFSETPAAWFWLAQAYERTGRKADAERARRQLERLTRTSRPAERQP